MREACLNAPQVSEAQKDLLERREALRQSMKVATASSTSSQPASSSSVIDDAVIGQAVHNDLV